MTGCGCGGSQRAETVRQSRLERREQRLAAAQARAAGRDPNNADDQLPTRAERMKRRA